MCLRFVCCEYYTIDIRQTKDFLTKKQLLFLILTYFLWYDKNFFKINIKRKDGYCPVAFLC